MPNPTTTQTAPKASLQSKPGKGQGWEMRCEDKAKGTPYDCGFVLRNHDWNEFSRMCVEHARTTHGMNNFSEADVKASARQVNW